MKKSVILADNSYTIRRIVELSFSDEEEIELISFENGLNINDKILELKPAVVLADIKLPDTNGYEICRFINSTEELKDTKVFLIKGGFEPVDEEQSKDLKYEDFITKPFDSKALVITIKSLLEEPAPPESKSIPEEIPTSIPEDIPETDNLVEGADDIDFSDIKKEMEADDLLEGAAPAEGSSGKEDVQPSEEITQGSGAEEIDDQLSPETSDDLDNPFKDDNSIIPDEDSLTEEELKIKENIKIQEQELEIGSLTQEEINIKQDIKKQKLLADEDPLLDIKEEKDAAEPEASDTKLETTEPEEIKIDPSLDRIETSDLENVFSISGEGAKPVDEEKPEIETGAEQVKEDIPESIITEKVEKEVSTEVQEEAEPVVQESETAADDIPEITVTEEPAEISPEKEIKPEEEVKSDLESRISILNGLKDKDKIVEKVEDKLSASIKEILWEITPQLAEKIIKNEIKKLEEEIEKEYSK